METECTKKQGRKKQDDSIVDVKMEWKDPANFESIKRICKDQGVDWKTIPESDRAGIINLIKRG